MSSMPLIAHFSHCLFQVNVVGSVEWETEVPAAT